MSEVREMVCIVCPVGCRLRVEKAEAGIKVTGNACPKGARYATEEMTSPTRTVTSSVAVSGGHMRWLSVKTGKPIPKGRIGDVLSALRSVQAAAPVAVGDVVLRDAAGTGVDVVATRSIRKA